MNYKDVKKKKNSGKVAITVLSILMVVALAVTGSVLIYNKFYKEDSLVEEDPVDEVKNPSLSDIKNVTFTEENYSFCHDVEYYSSFNGEQKLINTHHVYYINLHKDGTGEDFNAPEPGKYLFTAEFNGKTVSFNMIINSYSDDKVISYNCTIPEGTVTSSNINFCLVPFYYNKIDSSANFVIEAISSSEVYEANYRELREEYVSDGYSLVFWLYNEPIESFVLKDFKKVG